MKEELISFETAKLAKEKGFEIKTSDFFYKNDASEWDEADMYFRSSAELVNYSMIERPTQALLQKWLREEKGVVVLVCHARETKQWYVEIKYHIIARIEIKTYEQALEKGLFEAMKLLKK